MGYDLRGGLDGVAAGAPVPPEPLTSAPVLARARRARTVRAVSVAGTAAVVVAGLAVAVQAAPWREPPVAPATTPTPTAAPAPAPSAGPEVTSDPDPTSSLDASTAPPVGDAATAVAVTGGGDLVLLDPVEGTVVRTVAAGVVEPGTAPGLAMAPDGTAVYLDRTGDDVPWPGEVVRVTLDDGTVEHVAGGYRPAVSPDGRTLVYLGIEGTGEGTGEVRSIVLHDLGTGTTHRIVDDTCVGCERVLGTPAWAPDGGTVYVPTGWWDVPYTEEVVALDVSAEPPASLQDGRTVGPVDGDPSGESWYQVAVLPDGRLLVGGVRAPAGAPETWDPGEDTSWVDDEAYLAVVDPSTGTPSEQVMLPDSSFAAIAPGPRGEVVLAVDRRLVEEPGASDGSAPRYVGRLLSWEVVTGEVTEVSDDIVSIAW